MESRNEHIGIFANGISISIKREDLLHEHISGNKFRKLKYNLIEAVKQGRKVLLTFGGAYSNHIAAVSAAGKVYGLETVGVIRGEELAARIDENPTLSFARDNGMRLEFINREAYRAKADAGFIDALKSRFGDFYLIPEGGSNALAVRGCEEILAPQDEAFDYICCAVGTGATIGGLCNSAFSHQKVIGFPALKGDFVSHEVVKWTDKRNWEIMPDYHFGGYAKITSGLVDFINRFKSENKIQLDPVYTGKMMFGILDLAQKGFFPHGSNVLAIHTGGLQGIAGMNARLKDKILQ